MAHAATVTPSLSLLSALRIDLKSVEDGVPLSTMADFSERSGLGMSDLYDVVIPARTLKHRRSRREALSRDESDKLARLVRVFDQAVTIFGNAEAARSWIMQPKHRFAERTPLQMLRTELGGRFVEEMLVQIDDGMFA